MEKELFCWFVLMNEYSFYETRCFHSFKCYTRNSRDYCPPGRNDDKPARRISSTRIKFVAIDVLE